MAFKLDLNKAYDRVDWSFLHDMMMKMDFIPKWIQLIMYYITTVSYTIISGAHNVCPIIPK